MTHAQQWPTPVQPGTTKRKRKWPLVVTVCVLAVLLLCGGIAALAGLVPADKAGEAQEFAPTLAPEEPATGLASKSAPAATPSTQKATTTKPAPKPVPTINDGTWVVGEDIPAGTYKVNANVDPNVMCYWAIFKSGTNGMDIVANDLPTGGRPKVTIKNGQDFETEDCGTWTKVK